MNDIAERLFDPRHEIKRLLLEGALERLLEMTGVLHGHYCPGVALGVKAVHCAFGRLGIADNSGMEEVMAVAECNNCFVDGIQFVSGCSLGNNALVYKDLGKTAVTFYKRNQTDAVRVCAKPFELRDETQEEKKDMDDFFTRAVKNRETLTSTEQRRMKQLRIRRSFRVVSAPEADLFSIVHVNPPALAFAPIYDSQTCIHCGEAVMETRLSLRNGKPVCISCTEAEYRMVAGKGIVCCQGTH